MSGRKYQLVKWLSAKFLLVSFFLSLSVTAMDCAGFIAESGLKTFFGAGELVLRLGRNLEARSYAYSLEFHPLSFPHERSHRLTFFDGQRQEILSFDTHKDSYGIFNICSPRPETATEFLMILHASGEREHTEMRAVYRHFLRQGAILKASGDGGNVVITLPEVSGASHVAGMGNYLPSTLRANQRDLEIVSIRYDGSQTLDLYQLGSWMGNVGDDWFNHPDGTSRLPGGIMIHTESQTPYLVITPSTVDNACYRLGFLVAPQVIQALDPNSGTISFRFRDKADIHILPITEFSQRRVSAELKSADNAK